MSKENIVLVVADTLSAFHLPSYGYDRDTAPFLTELAEENVCFNYAYSNAPWTVPSHASIFSGKLPSEHGANSENLRFNSHSFVEDLKDEGYLTLGFSNNPLISTELGFDRGFEEFYHGNEIYFWAEGSQAFYEVISQDRRGVYESSFRKYSDFLKRIVAKKDIKSISSAVKYLRGNLTDSKVGTGLSSEDSGAEATNKVIKERLKGEEEPFFLFINYREPHEVYDPPRGLVREWVSNYDNVRERYDEIGVLGRPENIDEEFDSEFIEDITGFYDGEIRYLDDKIRELYNFIDDEFENVKFIVTGDHGENLSNYGLWGHQYGCFEKLLRVPLIIKTPDGSKEVFDGNFPLRNLAPYISSEDNLESLTRELVRASYKGAEGFFKNYSGTDISGYEGRKRKVIENRSESIIQGREGFISHTNMSDFGFRASFDLSEDSDQRIKSDLETKFSHIISEDSFDIDF
jgi:arylsulfatase A-like enzyme